MSTIMLVVSDRKMAQRTGLSLPSCNLQANLARFAFLQPRLAVTQANLSPGHVFLSSGETQAFFLSSSLNLQRLSKVSPPLPSKPSLLSKEHASQSSPPNSDKLEPRALRKSARTASSAMRRAIGRPCAGPARRRGGNGTTMWPFRIYLRSSWWLSGARRIASFIFQTLRREPCGAQQVAGCFLTS